MSKAPEEDTELEPLDDTMIIGGTQFPETGSPHQDTDERSGATLRRRVASCARRHYGVLWGLASAFVYSLQVACMEVAAVTMDPSLVAFVMSPVMLTCSVVAIIHNGQALPRLREHYLWLLMTGVAASGYVILLTFALSLADVGDVVTITYISCVLIAFLGWAMLGETFGVFDLLMAFITLAGVVFVSRPPFIFGLRGDGTEDYRSTLLGIGIAAATAIVITFVMISMRKQAVLGISAFHTMFANSLLLGITSIALCTSTDGWNCLTLREWMSSIGAGFCYFSGQGLCLCALKYERAFVVNIILTLEIIFAYVWQVLIMKAPPWWTSCVGSLLIIVSCIGVTVHRDQTKKRSITRALASEHNRESV